MSIEFYKYHGTGNDFILIDNRKKTVTELQEDHVKRICHRRFGIGADGLILLESINGSDFKMVYYNSDGRESSMCGNGGRCAAHLARELKICGPSAEFLAIDGMHTAKMHDDGTVELKMKDSNEVLERAGGLELDTGSPHFVVFSDDVDHIDIMEKAQAIRYNQLYREKGINVNFVQKVPGSHEIKVRTYERGVEGETYSCGTGVVAASIGSAYKDDIEGQFGYKIHTPGGELRTSFEFNGKGAKNVWLIGPAKFVFKGKMDLD